MKNKSAKNKSAKNKLCVFYTTGWAKNGAQISGGEIRLLEILKELKNHFIIDCITTKKDKDFLVCHDIDISYHLLNNIYDHLTLLPAYVCRMIQAIMFILIGNTKYDVFYSPSDFFPDVLPAFLLKRSDSFWIQVIHHIYPHWRERKGNILTNMVGYYLQRLSFYFIKSKADKVITVNAVIKERLRHIGFDKDKIVLSSNGINLDYIRDIKPAIHSYDSVYLGRLNYSKGVFDLIKIWSKVCLSIPDAKLGIIGGGKSQIIQKLKKEIYAYGMDKNVHIMGYMDSYAVMAEVKSSKCFVFPSHEEGWGVAIAEAMACGVPVVSWDLDVYQSVFEDKISKVKEGDFKEFSNYVISFVEDSKLRDAVSFAGEQFIEKYSWENVAINERELIRSLASSKSVSLKNS